MHLLLKEFIRDVKESQMTNDEMLKATSGYDVVEPCPKCKSFEVSRHHFEGSFALPECDYEQCDDCFHQWGHQ